jgi:MFS family permease
LIDRKETDSDIHVQTLAIGVGPLFVAPLSEFYGRWIICFLSLALFTIWNIPCAVATNVATELVGRWFSGMCGAAFLSVAGGVVGDLFSPAELQTPMLFYTLSAFLGPDIGPVLGGFINQYYHW